MNENNDRTSEVERTVFAVPKPPRQATKTCPWITLSRQPADPDATPGARGLLTRLWNASESDAILLGHQNAGHIGVTIKTNDGTDSDIKRVSGAHPAVVGIDALSLFGYEGDFDRCVLVTKALHREGVILTFSMHAPNFAICDEDLGGYSPNVLVPSVAESILPGGAYHLRYTRYLDRIAEYARLSVDRDGEPIPMIFRPFHENNGGWFWWGKDGASPALYRDIFRYTLYYLREEKGIRQFLCAYSPNGPFADEEEYLSTYPGDDVIDVIGFDMYHDRPRADDGWMEIFAKTCRTVASVARDHGKIAAVTETGIRMLDTAADGKFYEGLAPYGNPRKDWFSECADAILSDPVARRMAYVLFWANFSKEQFWVPYVTDVTHGHEMIDSFTNFLNRPDIALAGEF